MPHAPSSISICAARHLSTWARRIGAAILTAAASTASLSAQSTEGVTQWIRTHLEPIDLSTADSAVGPRALANVVSGARIVGIGESAHHKQELLQLRFKLTRELVIRYDFRAITMESGYADALLLDRWLREPSAAEPNLALALPYAGDGEFDEIRAAMRWLKRYNAGQPSEKRVRFIGIDLSNGGGSLRPPFDRAWEYLDRLDPTVARDSRRRIVPILDRLGAGYSRTAKLRFDSLPAADQALLDHEIASLRARLAARRALYAKSSSQDEHERVRHALEVAEQTLEFMRGDLRDPANPRDHALARNVEWALSILPRNTRMIVWAHNAHVQKQSIDVPQMNIVRPFVSLGQLLTERYGSEYRAIGTLVNRLPPDSTADPTSVDALFAGVGVSAYFVDLRDSSAVVPAWLRSPHLMRFESLYMRTAPATAFDALVFVERAVTGTIHRAGT